MASHNSNACTTCDKMEQRRFVCTGCNGISDKKCTWRFSKVLGVHIAVPVMIDQFLDAMVYHWKSCPGTPSVAEHRQPV